MQTEQDYRAFLLGLSDPESERLTEEGLLKGTLDADELLRTEDELIDDYLFGRLNGAQLEKFNSRFLAGGPRKDKLNLARALMRQATLHASETGAQQRTLKSKPLRDFPRVWKITLSAGTAAAAIVLVLLSIHELHLSRELDQARKTNTEVERLRAELSEERSHMPANPLVESRTPPAAARISGELRTSVDLWPSLARGTQPVAVLRLPAGESTVSINLELSAPLKGKFREDLVGGDGNIIWTQEFDQPLPNIDRSTIIALPTALLIPGNYVIHIEVPADDGNFAESDSYSFAVDKNLAEHSPVH